NPGSRRALARARAGELKLRPESAIAAIEQEARPGIFRLYEEQIGTITPLVGDRLIEAEESYPLDWIEQAFREAAELNIRNWRYIERILKRWAEEGRANETVGRDTREEPQLRFFGESSGPIARYR
ncbi:MAG: DnaD domain protein, partial [Tepidiformaceae bacterium]